MHMASSSENDENSFSDDSNDDNAIFYDANSHWSDHDLTESPDEPPRWALPSKSSEQFCTLPLTENQSDDLARRQKLQRLRAQEDQATHHHLLTSPFEPISVFSFRTQLFIQSNQFEKISTTKEDRSPAAPDLLKEHLDSERFRQSKQVLNSSLSLSPDKQSLLVNSSPIAPFYQHQRSLPYPTLPAISSIRGSNGLYSKITNLSAISEPNIVDISQIDGGTKFGDLSSTSRKLANAELFSSFLLHQLGHGNYPPLTDANPINEKILERVHGNNSLMTPRHSSLLNSNHNQLRRNSSDLDNINGTVDLDTSLSRQKHSFEGNHNEHDDDDDDNESTSSASSSTKSSHTIAVSSPSTVTKSSKAAVRAASSLFHGGKRQLTRLVNRSFLRRSGRKFSNGHHHAADLDEEDDDGEKLLNDGFNGDLKYKASRNHKEQLEFDKTQLLQTIVNAHHGPIWCMRFSPDGHLLATGGQDSYLKVWVLKSAQPYFHDFSRITSNLSKQQNEILTQRFTEFHQIVSTETQTSTINTKLGLHEMHAPLYSRPFCEFVGHQAPVLDVAWSKSLFLLSSSMDKTVRLWHLSRLECLCFFRHVDFVSAISFHPRDDRYFVSASLDGHVRLWNIPDKRVVYWTLIPAQASSLITAAQANLITAVHFCDEGRKVCVGTFDGRFLLYNDSLQYDTVMNIGDKDGSRSHRSRKKCPKPYKITGIESMNSNNSRVLITSNDSRVRLYDVRSKEIERKYRGYSNQSSQIRASVSHDDLFIISGSEDGWFYIWRTEPSKSNNKDSASNTNATLARKQRRQFGRAFERIRVHNTMVTSAIFAPNPNAIVDFLYATNVSPSNEHSLFTNRSSTNVSSSARSIPTSTSTVTPLINHHNRTRLICVHASSSPTESSMSGSTSPGNTYIMVTADSKGQLKLLVNRLAR